MAAITDDTGTELAVPGRIVRVVSLVPSLTETIALSFPKLLVGATDWCTQPRDLDLVRVRGTKNPNLRTIVALRPDLVVANKEENRRADVESLRRAGIAVWVSVIESVEDAFASLRRLFEDALHKPVPSWLATAEQRILAPVAGPRLRAVIPIWRDPWMVVGSSTFAGDLARHGGLDNVFADSSDRYPHVSLGDILAGDPELIVLPDEPYAFTAQDGPEAFPGVRSVLVSGRELTWYGPSMLGARRTLDGLRHRSTYPAQEPQAD